ncbi:hypothetical protein B0I35DRAFT_366073, partial [Stachybotrys elegans]
RTRPSRKCNIRLPDSYKNKAGSLPSANGGFTPAAANIWSPDLYKWETLPDWTPEHGPDTIPKGSRQCILCKDPPCDCIKTKIRRSRPRIVKTMNGMGEGVVAGRDYQADEILGELTGMLAPLGKYEDGWAAVLMRDDLPHSKGKWVPFCLVYPRHIGSWVRKVNHSCEPNCLFQSMPVSGRWRVMLISIKPIKRGEWILVSYGEEYWKTAAKEGEKCLCNTQNCISKGGNLSQEGSYL